MGVVRMNTSFDPRDSSQTMIAAATTATAGREREPSRVAARGGEWAHAVRWIGAAALTFALAAVLLPFVGPAPLDWSRVWAREDPDWSILVQLRVSRTLLGLFGGGALALGGSLFQAMLRDALATPYTLGVSTGASLGAVVAIAMGWHIVAGVPAVWAGAFAGAAIVLLTVVGAATRGRQVSAFGLLLAGVATNSVCSALILLIHGLSGLSQSFAISRWLIGSLDAIDLRALGFFIALITTLSLFVIRQARQWNLLAVGDTWAATRGANVSRLLFAGYACGSVLAATTVALTGPIGFIGLVVPHLVRARVSADDRILMPCAFLFGGVLLAACDALGRVILAPAEVPAGAITAFIGGPYLVWLVRRRL
jgi:iron complex transport system permease protein